MNPIDLPRLGKPGRIVDHIVTYELTRRAGSMLLVVVKASASRHDIEALRDVLEAMHMGAFVIVPENVVSDLRVLNTSEVEQMALLLDDVLRQTDRVTPDDDLDRQADKLVKALLRRPRLFRRVMQRVNKHNHGDQQGTMTLEYHMDEDEVRLFEEAFEAGR